MDMDVLGLLHNLLLINWTIVPKENLLALFNQYDVHASRNLKKHTHTKLTH